MHLADIINLYASLIRSNFSQYPREIWASGAETVSWRNEVNQNQWLPSIVLGGREEYFSHLHNLKGSEHVICLKLPFPSPRQHLKLNHVVNRCISDVQVIL